MAWFRPMGANEVAYHQATVVGRGDDHPGAALAYYGSRGETPLRWQGAGAARLGLSGEVTAEAYEAAFGPGGLRDPHSRTRLVASTRPGFELVVSAHKSVAVLGVIGQADAMHAILDAETTASLEWLDRWFRDRGGRRGREQVRAPTGGLTCAVTRHATSRAGDPSPHDHVLVANVVEMLDERGGFKALDSAALRDTVEAATMVGRLHAAWRAVELGYAVSPDGGPSGNLRHWRVAGVPDEVCELFSKRSDEIAEHLAATGQRGYRAAGIAARASRSVKRHTGANELLPRWRAELEAIGWSADRLVDELAATQRHAPSLPFPLTDNEITRLAGEVLDVDGGLLARHKVFTRTQLIAELAPCLYGREPAELDRVLQHILSSREVVPLLGVAGVREQPYTTVDVLAAEQTIAAAIETMADRRGPKLDPAVIKAAVRDKEHVLGHPLTDGQRAVVEQVGGSGRAVSVVVGVAGSGKTTALDAASSALETAGYRVLGTSTSGQAARTLGIEAAIPSSTLASLVWRLATRADTLDARTVVIVDESSMADDADLARLVLAAERTGATLVLVGDHHQLDAVGPGGALRGILERRPDLAVVLDANVRQHDVEERHALAHLRDGSVPDAIGWYARRGRIRHQATRLDTLTAMVDAWAGEVAAGRDTALLAWRRVDVADLNRLARHEWDRLGHLVGDDVVIDGRPYAAGDRLVALAPNPTAGIVTSEQLTVTAVTAQEIHVRTGDGRPVSLIGPGMDSQHLDHAYAVTVHRSQGATHEHAHVLAAGGGRELAYVALSRARRGTTIHVTADSLDQAVEQLIGDWHVERGQRWVTDTTEGVAHEAIEPVAPAAPGPQLSPRQRLRSLEQDYQDLRAGAGRWHDTPAGSTARQVLHARGALDAAQQAAHSLDATRRARRAAARSLPILTEALDTAQARWQAIGEPLAEDLRQTIRDGHRDVDRQDTTELRRALDEIRTVEPPSIGRSAGLEL